MDTAESPHVLLTNDDGIDAPGLRALYDALSASATVTVVAPKRNQSAVGRSLSYGRTDEDDDLSMDVTDWVFSSPVPYTEHELGYAVDGTPCDCAIVGVNALEPTPDLVVSGCNVGANMGTYVFSRSGTVSAALEAAFLGTPAIAVSMDTLGYEPTLAVDDFAVAADVVADIVEAVPDVGLFDRVDYLNINVPAPDREPTGLEVTRPTDVYEMDAEDGDGKFELTNRLWKQMAARDIPDPPGTDRHAILEGRISISPLATPYEVVEAPSVEQTLERTVSSSLRI